MFYESTLVQEYIIHLHAFPFIKHSIGSISSFLERESLTVQNITEDKLFDRMYLLFFQTNDYAL